MIIHAFGVVVVVVLVEVVAKAAPFDETASMATCAGTSVGMDSVTSAAGVDGAAKLSSIVGGA